MPPFPVIIFCDSIVLNNVFLQVAFNGHHYCEYRHRIPKERITHLVVVGDMHLQNMSYHGPMPVADVKPYITLQSELLKLSKPIDVVKNYHSLRYLRII